MAWTLTVYDETGVTVVDTITDADLTPKIHGGFKVVVRSSGDCVSLQFRGRNDLLRIRPRYVVQLNADGNDLFWGVIVRNPNFDSKGAGPADGDAGALEEYIAEGGRTLLRQSMMGTWYMEYSRDVGEMMKDFLQEYGHPVLAADVSAIQNPGAILARYYKPNAQLDMVFDELTSTVPGWEWGVNAAGRVFFKEAGGYLQFAASDLLDFVYRPADAEDVVSKVHIVVAGSPAGTAPTQFESVHVDTEYLFIIGGGGDIAYKKTQFDYVPKPVVFTYEDPLHSFFRAERSFALPEGINPFLEPDDAKDYPGIYFHAVPLYVAGQPTGWTDIEGIYSRDGSEYAESNTSSPSAITYSVWFLDPDQTEDIMTNLPIKGFRLVYQANLLSQTGDLKNGTHALMRLTAWNVDEERTYFWEGDYGTQLNMWWALSSAPDLYSSTDSESYVGLYSVMNPSAQQDRINAREDEVFSPSGFKEFKGGRATVSVYFQGFTDTVKIHYFYPLILNETLLTEVAKANIKIPRTMPGDAIVRGYSPPVAVVGVEGVFYQGALVDEALVDEGGVGDATVDFVDTVEYVLSAQDGFTTRYIIGNDDVGEAAKVLKQYVEENTARENYALMMTTRQ
jgi:hypothetical protein